MSAEVVRGRLDDELAEGLVRFWTAHGALDPAGARARLPEVVCVLRDDAGAIAGASSVVAAPVSVVGGRTFWIYRSFAPAHGADALIAPTYAALAAEFDEHDAAAPVGLCVALTPPEAARRPEAVWDDPPLLHAGYLPDGRQVRIAYFPRASIVPGQPSGPTEGWPDEGPPIELFAEQDKVDADAVVDFWLREDAMPEPEARRRVEQLQLVAVADDGEIAGTSTGYVELSPRLRTHMWTLRAYVGLAHRRTVIGGRLMFHGRSLLIGRDPRAAGVLIEVENVQLNRLLPNAVWLPSDFTFIGLNERGHFVRVHWFPGARVPPQGST